MEKKARLIIVAGATSALLVAVGVGGTASARSSSDSNAHAIGVLYADAGMQPAPAAPDDRPGVGRAPTAMEQSNAERDLRLTQAIRKGITANDSMSTEARNVTIVTQDGIVTLSGPVKTAQEKAVIESMANSAGAVRVHNQIEVMGDRSGEKE